MREVSWAALSARNVSAQMGGIYRAYLLAGRQQMDFYVAEIPSDTPDLSPPEVFNPERMEQLFKVGFDEAVDATPWKTIPPGLSPEEILDEMP